MSKFINQCPVCYNSESLNYERTLNSYDLVKCNACDFVFADLSNEDALIVNSTISDKVDAEYHNNQTGIDQVWFRYFAKKVSKKSPDKGKLLDIGCGNGVLLSIFRDFGWTLFGNDLSPWAQKYADKYGYKLYNQLIEKINFKNEFNCIVSTSTFEHVVNPLHHLSVVLNALQPGGYYWATLPNHNSLSIRLNISPFEFNQPPFHINYFTPKALKNLFKILQKEHKFSYSIKTYGIPELFSFYIFLNKFIAKFKIKKKKKSTVHTNSVTEPKSLYQEKKSSYLKNVLYKLIVLLNYYGGRFFLMGDKIEFYIRKE